MWLTTANQNNPTQTSSLPNVCNLAGFDEINKIHKIKKKWIKIKHKCRTKRYSTFFFCLPTSLNVITISEKEASENYQSPGKPE